MTPTPKQQQQQHPNADAQRVREFIRRQPKDTQQTLRRVLRERGIVGADEDQAPPGRREL